jgi:hypothetical protein
VPLSSPATTTTDAQAFLSRLDDLSTMEGRLADMARERVEAVPTDAMAFVAYRYHAKLADTLKHAALTIRLYTN